MSNIIRVTTRRDYLYIENRLFPGGDTMLAVARLREIGLTEAADELAELIKEFNDKVREFRYRLTM